MDQLFIKEINLARIANPCSQDDVNSDLNVVLDKFKRTQGTVLDS